MGRRLRAAFLGIVAGLSALAAPGGGPIVLGAAVVAAYVSEAAAQSRGRSSGGYSRPAMRTPSVAPSRPAPRTPSTSGGYQRVQPGVAAPSLPRVAPSAGDQAISRERASQALQDQRARQQPAQPAPTPTPTPNYATGGGTGWTRDDRRQPAPARSDWFGRQGWTAPAYVSAGPRSFGTWDALFLWFMLDNLTRPGYAAFLRNQATDPGLQQWRAQADGLARDNADLRRKLAELDAAAPTSGTDTGWVEIPAGIPASVAAADVERPRTPGTGSSGFGTIVVLLVVLGGAAVVAVIVLRRRRTGGGAMPLTPLQTAGAMLHNAVSGKPYRPELFRVGMVLKTDLSPFILAAGATKVTPPEASAAGTMTVAAVGRVGSGPSALIRLHLADRRGLFQLHLNAEGVPDECRFFTLIDEVAPADAAEWGVWLDPAEGMIGWPEFQTKDGKTYARAWSPGTSRIAPFAMDEAITTAEGTETIRMQTMLYAAPTGLEAPAPQAEYILVSAVERAGQAWVELRAGIDINQAALELT